MSGVSLPDDAKAVIWRIFGEGESPLKQRSAFDLIKPIIRAHVSPASRNSSISEIIGWFDSYGDQHWLKSDKSESVAALILEGVSTVRDETAIWAIGSIEADLAARIIRSLWTVEDVKSFIKNALEILEKVCELDKVLDASCISGIDSPNAKIPKDSVHREGRLETFQSLDRSGYELVHHILLRGVGNLIDLMVDLQPEVFLTLIERLDHPVMRTRVAQRKIPAARRFDHRASLQWITKDSCDAQVALGIVHTLNTVVRLDDELQYLDRTDKTQQIFSTELRPPQDDLDSAATGLLTGLVNKLATLDPLVCVRWIGELLGCAPYMLPLRSEPEVPRRLERLEKACTELLARLVCQSWSDDLLAKLRAGLCLTPRNTWSRHLADVAWKSREADPTRAAHIASVTLKEHERYVAEQSEYNRLFLDWRDWYQRQWFIGLGRALVLSRKELDLPQWLSARCRTLPLSVWDAEENYVAFFNADRAVEHWFLIAFHAISVLKELGRMIDPAAVRTLAEMLSAHYQFAGTYFQHQSDTSVVAEHAIRYAVEYGEPSDEWILNQARHPGVGSRALCELIDKRNIKVSHEGETDVHYRETIATEFATIVADRFRNTRRVDLEALRYWGWLWLLLEAVEEAEQTAMAIIAFELSVHDRADKILTLKLLALVASSKKLPPTLVDYPALLYNQLWTNHTPQDEIVDCNQINEVLKRSLFPVL